MSYNLNENVKEFIDFTLGEHNYKFRLPTTEEVEQLQKIKDDKERGRGLFKYVEPVSENAPEIETELKKYNVQVTRNFVKMIEAEMGV